MARFGVSELSSRRLGLGAVGLLVVGLVQLPLLWSADSVAAVSGYHIKTDGRRAVVRNGPGTNYSQVDSLENGTAIDIRCQQSGGPAYTNDGRASYIWDQLNS